MSYLYDLCLPVEVIREVEEFTIDKGWIAGAFFLGLFIGGGLAACLIPTCLKDWEKKKRQDEEELIENDTADAVYTPEKQKLNEDEEFGGPKKSRFAAATAFFKRKKNTGNQNTETKENKGWVQPESKDEGKTPNTNSVGIVTILTKPNSGEADAELTKQDIDEMDRLDNNQKDDKNDMMLKMLKMKLRKMKGKGQIGDPYLADFTQKIIDTRKSNDEIIAMDRQEGEDELRKKHGKNKAALENEIDNLNIKLEAKRNQLQKDEMEMIRGELIRTSGLSEAEVDDLIDKLKQELAEFERRQGLEQARQAQHLAERLERRRQLVEFRRLQEQQSKDKVTAEVKAFEEPLDKLVEDGKLIDRQKKEVLDEHQRNLQNLQKQHDLDSMRLQVDLAEKLRKRREQRMNKLADKHMKEKASFLQKSEKSTNSADFSANFQSLLQQQQQEVEATQMEIDQTEIQELDRLTQDLEEQKEKSVQEMSDKMVQSVSQMGQLPESDVKRIIKLHNLRMDAFDQRRRDELERTRARLQQKMQERMKKVEEDRKQDDAQREAILDQQDKTVKRVLNSNIDLSEEAKEKILKEHERNMVALNNQLSRSKAKQQMSLEHKLSQRKARLAEIQAQQAAILADRKNASEKEIQKLQDALDQEMALFEKERREAEANLRKRLAAETEAALTQQEKELAVLMGRLEVGTARRQAVLQKQDQTLKELQAQLESKIEDGRLSANKADQIIQQHYNQVEHVNDKIQMNRERQEQMINEKIQAKKFAKQREIEDELNREKQEMMMTRKQAGAGMASAILNKALMDQRHRKAMEELEKEMQVELEKNREQLNAELQKSLEKELEAHKGEFLNQLAAASKIAPSDLNEISGGGRRSSGSRFTRDSTPEYGKTKSTLGAMEEDSDEDTRQSYNRPHSAMTSSSKPHHVGGGKKKKKHIFGPQPPRPAFSTSTGEQIHSAWDLDDELL
ncbi:trichohyalin-like isoform X2 [Ruditapes philippinarum]|uniref:trichohyalin-like isoform X2 n=1 Tax=Ruditapes philippinarum TaxID=129788 RepID=UPI00295ABAA9|nr:trichohyalin-like isoform X2 [Ruditapes philippinarum]